MPIFIRSLGEHPLHEIVYEYPGASGYRQYGNFQIATAVVDGFPSELDALFLSSDLQGVTPAIRQDEYPELLGMTLSSDLEALSELGEICPGDRLGVVLGGDLYVSGSLEKRGGKGDVRDVWLSFHSAFRWVAGVAGNHDRFGDAEEFEAFLAMPGIYFLDGESIAVDGLRIGGVSGIVGNPRRPFRRGTEAFLAELSRQLDSDPDILVLHEGPGFPEINLPGSPEIREVLERGQPSPLVVCGHSKWDHPLHTMNNGTQVLNVEGRGLLLIPGN